MVNIGAGQRALVVHNVGAKGIGELSNGRFVRFYPSVPSRNPLKAKT